MAPMNSALAVRSRLLGKPEDDFRDAPPRRRLGNLLTLGWLGPLFFTAVAKTIAGGLVDTKMVALTSPGRCWRAVPWATLRTSSVGRLAQW